MPHKGGWSGRQREDAGRGLGDELRGRGLRQVASGRDVCSAQVRDDALVEATTVSWGCDVLFATVLPPMRLLAPPEDPTAYTVAHKVTYAAGGRCRCQAATARPAAAVLQGWGLACSAAQQDLCLDSSLRCL